MDDTAIRDAKKQAFIAKRQAEKPSPSMYGDDPASRAWRAEQARVDADIEGLARDPAAESLLAEMDRDGLSDEEQIERLTAYYRDNIGAATAAE